MTKHSRISFGQHDAAHLYDLALEHFCISKKEGVCPMCINIKQHLEKYIWRNGSTAHKAASQEARVLQEYMKALMGMRCHARPSIQARDETELIGAV